MPRALWKGAISFRLVTIPVSLHAAVERGGELHFRLLHAKDGSPVDYRRFCQEEGVEVPWDEIAATQTFDIRDFVPGAEIEPRYFDHPYFVAPAGRSGVKAYALRRDAMAETGRVGIGKLVLRRREHLGALQASGPALVLTTMREADELRDVKDLDLPPAGKGWSRKEMDLARA